MKKIILILLVGGFVAFAGCDKSANPLNTDELDGTWSWFKSIDSMGAGETTPEDCKCSMTYVFEEDRYRFLTDGTVQSSGTFEIREFDFDQDGEKEYYLYLDDSPLSIHWLDNGEITLYPELCLSCPLMFYRKMSDSSGR